MTTENKNNASSNADVEASAASTLSNKEPVVETASMTAQPQSNARPTQQIERKFELAVFDIDEQTDANGIDHPVTRRVHSDYPIIVKVKSPGELNAILNQYKMCGQVAKIIREIDPPPKTSSQQNVVQHVDIPTASTPIQNANPTPQHVDLPRNDNAKPVAVECVKSIQAKPKIITIGDMQIKYDGDKVYQKQWVKLNQNEASQIRVVNDSSNKIVSLNGKHIEILRWVVVEEQDSDDDSSLKFS